MPFEDNTLESYFTIDAGKMGLSPGIYILRLSNGTETVTEKIVITR